MVSALWTATLLSLAAVAGCAWLAALMRECGVRPVRGFVGFLKGQPKAGRVIIGVFLAALWMVAGAKPGGPGNSGASAAAKGEAESLPLQGGGDGATIGTAARGGDDALVVAGDKPASNGPTASDGEDTAAAPSRALVDEDFARGFVLTRVGTGESFCFAAPSDATVCAGWMATGSASDWIYLAPTGWSMRIGDATARRLRVHSDGWVEALPEGGSPRPAVFAPLRTALGLAPEAKWPLLPASARPSLLWHLVTPSNTLMVTWRNALLGRSPSAPVSLQLELGQGGSADFRYSLSAVPDGAALPAASACGAEAPVDRQVTSLGFASALDLRCVRCMEGFRARLGGLDPLSCPPGSTNTVWEHLVYSGTADGEFTLPEPTGSSAVLRISVSGSGEGVLDVGGVPVPLVGVSGPAAQASAASARPMRAPAAPPPTLLVCVPRGRTVPLYLRRDGSLTVSLSSGDFAFGVLPDPAGGTLSGWVNFPCSGPTPACVHDYGSRSVTVTLPAGADSDGLRCSWSGASDVEARNVPPRSATLVASFGPRGEGLVTYALSHPLHLFGAASGTQTVRFCPVPPDRDPDRPDPYDPPDPPDPDNPDDPDDGDGEEEDPEPDEPDPSGSEEGPDGGGEGGGPPPAPPCRCDRATCDGSCGCCAYPCCGLVDPDGYDEARTNAVRMSGVMLVREPPLFGQPIRLEVPDGDPRCCPCLDHARRRVELVLRRGLEVVGPDGTPFTRSAETVDVRVAATGPSRWQGDAFAAFATNGAVTLECAYTALGVGIASPAADLDALAALSPAFGLPVPVCTNAEGAAALTLATDVLLGGMNIHVGFEGADAPFALWVRRRGGWRRIASSGGGALDVTLPAWRSLAGARPGDMAPRTEVRVTAAAPGSATLVFRAWGAVGGRFVEDEARRRITAVSPPVMADHTRDGRIDGGDLDVFLSGRPYRFWTNPSAEDRVGGEGGLVNLFPVAVDVSPFVRAWGGTAEVRLRACEGLLYCLPDGVAAERASMLWTDDVRTRDGAALRDAALLRFPDGGLDVGGMPAGGVLALTAVGNVDGWESPELVVSLGGAEVFRQRLPVSLRPVREMYRFLSVRGSCGDGRAVGVRAGDPPGLPDAETDGRHFVFVHGYNVDPGGAREWADAMFKRLLLAGSRSMFTAVTWFGDYARIWEGVPVVGGESLNYYRNVRHAFMSAEPFRATVEGLPGRKVLLAHSLGNMLVSSAIVDHGLTGYGMYHMLNAAVPMEAYDREAQTDCMVDGAWRDVSPRHRASRWHGWFAAPDFRAGLAWKGRFGVIPRAENCYSETEDVLANPTMGGIGDAWSAQELLKGTAVLYGTDLLLQGIAVEGGWGISARHVVNPLAYVPGVGLNADYFAGYTREQSITTPLFTSFDDGRMASTNALDFADEELRAKMLGDAIPAESFAAGANALRWFVNYEYLRNADHGWPDEDEEPKWRHSDIKNVDYRYVQDFFRHIKEATE